MLCCHASSGWGRKQWKNGFQENVLSSNFPLLVATFLAKADHVRSWFVQFWSLDHGMPCPPGFVVTRCLQLGGHRSSSSLVWWRRESTLMILLVPLATSRVQVGLVDLLGDYDLCKVIVMTNTWRCLFHTIPLQSWGVAGLTVFYPRSPPAPACLNICKASLPRSSGTCLSYQMEVDSQTPCLLLS